MSVLPKEFRCGSRLIRNGSLDAPQTGFLALTFGTLLSSQGADAHLSPTVRPCFGATLQTYTPCPFPFTGGRTGLPASAWGANESRHTWSKQWPEAGPSTVVLVGVRFSLQGVVEPYDTGVRGVKPGGSVSSRMPQSWPQVTSRAMPAIERFPLRSNKNCPCSQSDSPGTNASSVTRSLFR